METTVRRGGVRVPLRAKWTLSLLFAGSVPVAMLGWATLAIQRGGLETAERQLEVSVIDHVGNVVDATLDDSTVATQRVGAILGDAKLNPDARVRLAQDAVGRAPGLGSVAIYDDKGALLDAILSERAGEEKASAPEKLPTDGAALPEGGAWLVPEYAGGRATLRWASAVQADGKLWGYVLATLARGALDARLSEISRDRFEGRSDGVVVLDGDGRVLAGRGTGALAVGATVLGRDLFTTLQVEKGAFAQPIAWATEFVAEDGEAMVGSARSLPSRGWAVVVRRPRAVAYAALGQARTWLAAALSLAVLAAIALGSWLGARATRPVQSLMGLASAYASRQFQVRSTVATRDELEDLGRSMSDMAGAIATGEVELARRAAVEADLSRYLPAEVARAIAEGRSSLALGGQRRRVSILFADVAAFTNFAESAQPEQVVALLNELFSILAEVVFRHGGTVDKFIGDSIMAIFGAPNDQADHAERALATAEDMHRFVEANGPAWQAKYGVEVRLAIGVSSGTALVGNLGSERRMEYTAIGDVVNVAARLEWLAQPGKTLVTDEVRKQAETAFDFVSLGEQKLRGKQHPVAVFEVA